MVGNFTRGLSRGTSGSFHVHPFTGYDATLRTIIDNITRARGGGELSRQISPTTGSLRSCGSSWVLKGDRKKTEERTERMQKRDHRERKLTNVHAPSFTKIRFHRRSNSKAVLQHQWRHPFLGLSVFTSTFVFASFLAFWLFGFMFTSTTSTWGWLMGLGNGSCCSSVCVKLCLRCELIDFYFQSVFHFFSVTYVRGALHLEEKDKEEEGRKGSTHHPQWQAQAQAQARTKYGQV